MVEQIEVIDITNIYIYIYVCVCVCVCLCVKLSLTILLGKEFETIPVAAQPKA
jgi:hypothetical protein